jgi:hypoxanthine phosphoribosyltransferase
VSVARARLGRTVVSAQQIADRLPTLAHEIEMAAAAALGERGHDGDHDDLVIVPVMTGAFIFAADLVRRMPARMRISLVAVSSYPGTSTSSQGVRPLGDLPADLRNRRVLLVDDVLDSGRTLGYLRKVIAEQQPRWFATAVLLRKTIPSALSTPCEFVGFDIPDEFVVGYGLDYDGCFRNVPDVRVLHLEGGA